MGLDCDEMWRTSPYHTAPYISSVLCIQSEYFKSECKDKVDLTKQFRFQLGIGHMLIGGVLHYVYTGDYSNEAC